MASQNLAIAEKRMNGYNDNQRIIPPNMKLTILLKNNKKTFSIKMIEHVGTSNPKSMQTRSEWY